MPIGLMMEIVRSAGIQTQKALVPTPGSVPRPFQPHTGAVTPAKPY
jgi:hypothetical protein